MTYHPLPSENGLAVRVSNNPKRSTGSLRRIAKLSAYFIGLFGHTAGFCDLVGQWDCNPAACLSNCFFVVRIGLLSFISLLCAIISRVSNISFMLD